jgi:hypothetical protein
MKFILFTLILSFLILFANTNGTGFEAHLKALNHMKTGTKSLLENLYATANMSNRRSKEVDLMMHYQEIENIVNHTNQVNQPGVNPKEYRPYDYYTYSEIVQKLKQLAAKYPKFMELKTAQELYGLPNPGGMCKEFDDENRLIEKKCFHYIAFLTNKEVNNKNKAQVYCFLQIGIYQW